MEKENNNKLPGKQLAFAVGLLSIALFFFLGGIIQGFSYFPLIIAISASSIIIVHGIRLIIRKEYPLGIAVLVFGIAPIVFSFFYTFVSFYILGLGFFLFGIKGIRSNAQKYSAIFLIFCGIFLIVFGAMLMLNKTSSNLYFYLSIFFLICGIMELIVNK